jgi:hypothetical protein
MVRDSAGRATLLMYDDGNHVCNNIPYKYRPRQADWMMRELSEVRRRQSDTGHSPTESVDSHQIAKG